MPRTSTSRTAQNSASTTSGTAQQAAAGSPFGGLFSAFSSFGNSDFVDTIKKIGLGLFNFFKGFADGSIRMEPLDIFTAISDLFKSFFNVFSSNDKAAPAPGQRSAARNPSPEFSDAEPDNAEPASRGDFKRRAEEASTASVSGLGFSEASQGAGLGYGRGRRSNGTFSNASSFGAEQNQRTEHDGFSNADARRRNSSTFR